EQREEHEGQDRGDGRERPRHAPIAGQLLIDRLDAQPQATQPPAPDGLPGKPVRLQLLGGLWHRSVRFHEFNGRSRDPARLPVEGETVAHPTRPPLRFRLPSGGPGSARSTMTTAVESRRSMSIVVPPGTRVEVFADVSAAGGPR